MYGTLKIVWSVVAVCLVVLILLHSPKSDGLGGFSGQAQLFSSTKSAETALNRVTWFLTVLFLGLTIVLSGGWFAAPVVTSPAPVAPAATSAPIPLDLPAQTAPSVPTAPTAPTATPETP